jgi:CelD/BcsL family acetyltransferase involved in cellulose biosynthesis
MLSAGGEAAQIHLCCTPGCLSTTRLKFLFLVGFSGLADRVMTMRIERVDTFAEFQRLRMAWDTIYQSDPEAQFFLSWQWLAGALESYPGEWLVLIAYSADGTHLGFLPLRRKTVWSKSRQQLRNELQYAGRLFWSDYGGILCLPEHEEAVLGAFAAYLKQLHWSHFYLKGFRISDRRFGLFMAPFADERFIVESLMSTINEGETDNLVSPYIDLPDTFEAYLAGKLSSNTRQKLRRFLRKLESSSEYQLTTTNAATQARDVQILETLWSKMRSEQKGANTQRLATKYGRIVHRGLEDETVHLLILWHGGTPLGALASFVDWDKSRLLFFVSGREEDFRELPVGLILHACNVRWAIEHGIRTYDFLRGNEPYKYSLGATDLRLQYPLVRTRSGTNPNGKLDPGCIDEALRLADDFARRNRTQRAMTVCNQVLATVPGHEAAQRLLDALADVS